MLLLTVFFYIWVSLFGRKVGDEMLKQQAARNIIGVLDDFFSFFFYSRTAGAASVYSEYSLNTQSIH